ncbi:hypothetical protein AVEN_208215-1 [Araneus ventricosus]|uniref:Uncharacterized protein n=1 Tax=Araneus ventricosus TaxID=182803 RepID=A0A4Y2LFN3_ARAVE|nr:hypothetical protein AVEN_208215-1 [Araneus ventricosus]
MHFCNVHTKVQMRITSLLSATSAAALLRNLRIVALFFIRGRSHMGRGQRNKLVVEAPECDVLTVNLTQGTCEPAPYSDGALTTWPSPG